MLRSTLAGGLVSLLPLLGGPALGAGPGEASANVQSVDAAIGRINHAGYRIRRHCTVTALSRNTALTARHCVDGLKVDELHLLFGYDRMAWSAHLNAVATIAAAPDVAAVCLTGAPPATRTIADEAPAEGERVSIVGYGRPRVHVQNTLGCRVTGRSEAFLRLDCPSPPGTSGAPVLNERGAVVGVISQSRSGASLAVRVPPSVTELCAKHEARLPIKEE